MTPANDERRFSLTILVILVTLAAASGAVLTLIVGTIAGHVGPGAGREATSARCQCDDAEVNADGQTAMRPADQNDEVRRAFLAAVARNPRCDDDTLAEQADALTPLEFPLEHQEELDTSSPEEMVEQEEAEVVSLQSELNHESVDPEWAPATEQATALAIAAAASMYLDDVTCGESLCRVQVTHSDLAKREEDVEKLLGTIPGGGQARVYAPSDEPTTVMYFSREGMKLSVMTPSVPGVPLPPLDLMDSAAVGEDEIPLPPEVAY